MTPQEEIAPLGDVPVEIETGRSAGENIDIYIGGVLCGSGEIVVIENTLGVRITDFRDG
jgi:flagellar motor switch protein FliN/FliY